MLRKSEYFELTDKYINSELTQPELTEFEAQMAFDSDLTSELNLHRDVEQAIAEQDVTELRNSLNQIIQNNTDSAENKDICVMDAFSFGLAEEFNSNQSNQAKLNNIGDIGHSFPKIHLFQHKIAAKENIHQFYKEQFDSPEQAQDDYQFNPFDEELFAEVQNALEETDIADIRANLSQIAQSLSSHQYSTQDIEDYIYNVMDETTRLMFDQKLSINPDLANEVELIAEVDLALAESDIMDLRASLNAIQKTEAQNGVSFKDIENYISLEMNQDEIASFEQELASNAKLQHEIALVKDIDAALVEDDIMALRVKLQSITSEIAAEKQSERSFAARFKTKRFAISTIAASLVLLLGLSGILSWQSSQNDIYSQFYSKYEATGAVRSAEMNANKTLSEALNKYENKDYQAALELFNQLIAADQNNMAGHFYSAVSLQETGKYLNAISEYQTVINNNDNLFTQQAQWYSALCYLQINDEKKAVRQFRKIAENKGFYQAKAQQVLKKIKISD